MRKIEKILVPIDFSQDSASALGRGLTLASETGAELIALHVIEPSRLRDYFNSYLEAREASPLTNSNDPIISMDVLMQDKTRALANFIEKAAPDNIGVKITKRVTLGSTFKEIAAMTQTENIDLVVLKLRKRFPFTDFATLRILRFMRAFSCPVLLDTPIADERVAAKTPLLLLRPAPEENIG
jgi:nucleotide-binding universal stress UspA family protein